MQALDLKKRPLSTVLASNGNGKISLDQYQCAPLQMKWQLTLTEPIDCEQPQPYLRRNNMTMERNQTHDHVAKIQHHRITDIMHTLHTFNDYNYTKYSAFVVTGYLHEFQRLEAIHLPTDIRNVCLKFYFEDETKYFQFAYALYHSLNETNILRGFNGKELVSIIKRSLCEELVLHQFEAEDIASVCTKLLRYNIIEIMSFHTNFLSLFQDSGQKESFQVSANYTYNFVKCKIDAFKAIYT